MFFYFFDSNGYKQAMGKITDEDGFVLNQPIGKSSLIIQKYNEYLKEHRDSTSTIIKKILEEKKNSYIWGITDSKQNRESWEKLKKDDVVYFVSNNTIKYIGIVEEKINESYWSITEELSKIFFSNQKINSNKEWECIYFLKKIQKVEIPLYLLNRILGYDDNAVPRSLQIMKNDKDAQKTLFKFLISIKEGDN